MSVKAYKVFNPDWTCKGFQYRVGESYECNEVIICQKGFHACLKPVECFNYYSFNPSNKVAIVELDGQVVSHNDDSKVAATKIKIVQELSWHELLSLINVGKGNSGKGNTGVGNSGHYNAGNYNSGNFNGGGFNSGYYNIGYNNSGQHNMGDNNTGSCNNGYHNVGFFNSGNYNCGMFNNQTPFRLFNKECNLTMNDLYYKDMMPNFFAFKLCEWIISKDMTEQEKQANPNHNIFGGYLKTYTYREAWANYKINCDPRDWQKLLSLPNFDPAIFQQITGIKV